MEKLKDLISKKFGNKFSFIKPLEVVYNTDENVCTLTFLFPENNDDFLEEDKEQIANYLSETLNLKAKTECKFKKSYLEKDIIIDKTIEFFKVYHQGIFSVLKKENIVFKKELSDIFLEITIPEKVLQIIDKKSLEVEVVQFLTRNFCAMFFVEFFAGKNIDEKKIFENQQIELQNIIRQMKPTPRYEVFAPIKLVGKDITPHPEFLSKIKDDKESVILAGTIENLTKNSYKRTRKDKEIEKFYYKFTLKEDNQYLRMVYFCPKTYVHNMDKLTNGDSVLLIANIKKENKYLTGYVSSLSLCQIDNEIRKNSMETVKEYTTVFPEPFAVISQVNIFDVKKEYNDNIKNNSFVVFDVETTGLDPETCEIIEIGAVKMKEGVILEKFQSLVKPKGIISKIITDITGINEHMVKNSPPIEKVLKDFYVFAEGSILAGYNVAFDQKFIQNASKNINLKFTNQFFDVMPLAKSKLICRNYKLTTIVKKLNLSLENAHRAFFDALATAQTLLELSKI